jgi:putative PIN family toxin of toxin-antitoxin system
VSRYLQISAVFDCNVLLQATARNNSPASTCLRLAESGAVRLFVSDETLTEIEEILNRDIIKERFNLADKDIKEFLENLRFVAEVFTKVPKVFSLPRDVDDEEYINLAVESEADFIVTRDKDLLDLMTGHDDISKEFRQRFRPLKVVEPLEFLRIVEEKLKEAF